MVTLKFFWMKEIFSHWESQNSVVPSLRTSTTHSWNGYPEETMKGPWTIVLHMPLQWMHAIVLGSSGHWWETKCTWPLLVEMGTQRTRFKQSIVDRGHICRILTDSWHLYLLFVYIWAFTEMLKWFCKFFLYIEKLQM